MNKKPSSKSYFHKICGSFIILLLSLSMLQAQQKTEKEARGFIGSVASLVYGAA